MLFPWTDFLISLVFCGVLYLILIVIPYLNHKSLLRYYRRLWEEEDRRRVEDGKSNPY